MDTGTAMARPPLTTDTAAIRTIAVLTTVTVRTIGPSCIAHSGSHGQARRGCCAGPQRDLFLGRAAPVASPRRRRLDLDEAHLIHQAVRGHRVAVRRDAHVAHDVAAARDRPGLEF